MISEVTRLQFYSVTYFRKDKYKDKHLVKKRSIGYKERQYGHSTTQRRSMNKKNYSRSNDVEKEDDKEFRHIGRNKKE